MESAWSCNGTGRQKKNPFRSETTPGNAVFNAVHLVHSTPVSVAERFGMRDREGGEGPQIERRIQLLAWLGAEAFILLVC